MFLKSLIWYSHFNIICLKKLSVQITHVEGQHILNILTSKPFYLIKKKNYPSDDESHEVDYVQVFQQRLDHVDNLEALENLCIKYDTVGFTGLT